MIQIKPYVANPLFQQLLQRLLPRETPFIDVSEAEETYVFLDAREEKEYQVSHIKEAVHIGFTHFDITKFSLPMNQKIIVYCSVGWRSGKIGSQLINKGYEVYNLYGGIFEWINRGLTVYDAKGNEAKQVHGYSLPWGVWVKGCRKVYH